MSQGKPNNRNVSRCSRQVALLAALAFLTVGVHSRAASSPEQALRTRVEQLYTALQQGDWRKAEKFFTKESRPIYRAQPKKPITGYQIDSVKVDTTGKSAEVVVRFPAPGGLIPGVPVSLPETTVWRLAGGQWCMEIAPSHPVQGLPPTSASQQTSFPHFSIKTKDLKFQYTWLSVGPVHPGETKVARFAFTNVSQHSVTLADVESTCPCLTMTSQQREFKPGEAGVLEFTLDPSSLSFKSRLGLSLTVTLQTEPEHALTNLTIAAAITPSSEPAQHP